MHAGGTGIRVEVIEDEVHVLFVAGHEVLGVASGGLAERSAGRQEKQTRDEDGAERRELATFAHWGFVLRVDASRSNVCRCKPNSSHIGPGAEHGKMFCR